jgi:hypothetical protein
VRATLFNPRYTGCQIWNCKPTDEVLLHVDNVALGHAARMRWNPADQWLFSGWIAHPPLLARDQAVAIFLPGIGSASAVRQAGARKVSAKYCVSCTTCSWANSMMLTE